MLHRLSALVARRRPARSPEVIEDASSVDRQRRRARTRQQQQECGAGPQAARRTKTVMMRLRAGDAPASAADAVVSGRAAGARRLGRTDQKSGSSKQGTSRRHATTHDCVMLCMFSSSVAAQHAALLSSHLRPAGCQRHAAGGCCERIRTLLAAPTHPAVTLLHNPLPGS